MSVPTWCLYSVSDTSTPAMKAPSARLSPASSVSQARPSVISSRLSMNSSSLLRRATSVSHQRMNRCPPVSRMPTSTVALTSAHASAVSSWSDEELSAGINTSSGTTARSWNSRIPITRRPCSLSSSASSAMSLTTMAVLLIAITHESASAVCQPISHTQPTQRESTHDAQLGQSELQPDVEHQEHHANLAQVPHPFRVLRQRQRMGADEHPRSQVAEHGWQLEAAADHNTQPCGQQEKQGGGE